MKAPITQAIDDLVGKHLAPALKDEGFRKKGQRFWRSVGILTHVVEVDRWKYNEGNCGKFNIFVGVYSDDVWQLHERLRPMWGDGYNPFPPPIQNCLVDEAVLAPDHVDGDWQVDATLPIKPLGMAMTAAVRAIGLPWLARHQSLADCIPRLSELSNKNSWIHSVELFCIGALLKDAVICQQELSRVLSNRNRKGFPDAQRQAFRDLANSVALEANAS